ncbi:hypothetical protein [Spiroplasma diminutum]|nr:hypothetical protein [Spiroplasma diminutum]
MFIFAGVSRNRLILYMFYFTFINVFSLFILFLILVFIIFGISDANSNNNFLSILNLNFILLFLFKLLSVISLIFVYCLLRSVQIKRIYFIYIIIGISYWVQAIMFSFITLAPNTQNNFLIKIILISLPTLLSGSSIWFFINNWIIYIGLAINILYIILFMYLIYVRNKAMNY